MFPPSLKPLLLLGGLVFVILISAVLMVLRAHHAHLKLAPGKSSSGHVRVCGTWERARHKILVIGDSRISRWAPLPSCTDELAIAFSGVGGETSSQLAHRLPKSQFLSEADIVIFQIGVNDLVAAHLNPGESADIEAKLQENLRTMMSIVRKRGAHPVITAIGEAGPLSLMRRLAGYDGKLQERIKYNNSRLLTFIKNNPKNWIDFNAPLHDEMCSSSGHIDTLHFNRDFYICLDRNLLNYSKKYFKK